GPPDVRDPGGLLGPRPPDVPGPRRPAGPISEGPGPSPYGPAVWILPDPRPRHRAAGLPDPLHQRPHPFDRVRVPRPRDPPGRAAVPRRPRDRRGVPDRGRPRVVAPLQRVRVPRPQADDVGRLRPDGPRLADGDAA